jgi:hypothetical protein
MVAKEKESARYAASRIFQMEIAHPVARKKAGIAIYNWLPSTTYVPDVVT